MECCAHRYLLYSQREEELLSTWWKEYAECSEGPRGQPGVVSKSDQQLSSESPDHQQSAVDEERVGVPVKGGLYEVALILSSADLSKIRSSFANECI